MDILRITARWTGFPGAPGYSNFHFTTDAGFWDGGILGDSAQAAADGASERTSIAFNKLKSLLPVGAQIEIQREAEVLNSDNGEILGVIDLPGYAPTVGSGTGGYSGPSGAVVNWRTNDYRGGRRIRGRTFLVPLAGSAYEEDGTLTDAALTSLRDFGDIMITGTGGADLGVWSRPQGGTGGVWATVTSSNVPDLAAVLRSRRD